MPRDKKLSGRELRTALAKHGAKKRGPAFYQLMARLEESGFVEGEYSQKIVEDRLFKERHYRSPAKASGLINKRLAFMLPNRVRFSACICVIFCDFFSGAAPLC